MGPISTDLLIVLRVGYLVKRRNKNLQTGSPAATAQIHQVVLWVVSHDIWKSFAQEHIIQDAGLGEGRPFVRFTRPTSVSFFDGVWVWELAARTQAAHVTSGVTRLSLHGARGKRYQMRFVLLSRPRREAVHVLARRLGRF